MTTIRSEQPLNQHQLLAALIEDAQVLIGETVMTNLQVVCWEGCVVIVHNTETGLTAVSCQCDQSQTRWSEWRYCSYPTIAVAHHLRYEA